MSAFLPPRQTLNIGNQLQFDNSFLYHQGSNPQPTERNNDQSMVDQFMVIGRRTRFKDIQNQLRAAGGLEEDLNENMDDQDRRDIRNQKIRDIAFDLTLAILCISMPLGKWDAAQLCGSNIAVWLLVQSGFYFTSIFRHLTIIIVIYAVRRRRSNHIKRIVDFIYVCVIMNLQIAWLIYGNILHYSAKGQNCRIINDDTKQLWILMMIILSFGYLIFAGFLFIFFGCALVFILRIFHPEALQVQVPRPQNQQQQQISARIPGSYGEIFQTLRKKAFGQVQIRNMQECIICLEAYKEMDEIAELMCDERHYFHTKCLEVWLQRKLECPLCKKEVKPNSDQKGIELQVIENIPQ